MEQAKRCVTRRFLCVAEPHNRGSVSKLLSTVQIKLDPPYGRSTPPGGLETVRVFSERGGNVAEVESLNPPKPLPLSSQRVSLSERTFRKDLCG